jgi:PAS domain S-box-containing protein
MNEPEKALSQSIVDTYATHILETVRHPLLLLSATLHVVMANAAFYRMFGVDRETTEGRLVYELGAGEWNDARMRSLLEEILPTSVEFSDFELDQIFAGIGHRTMLLNARRLQHTDGNVQLILLAIEDVTERRRLEEELNATLRKLESRNRELQDYASIASHDLQEPLRKIQAFGERLAVACEGKLSPEAVDYLARMQNAATRMRALITDLLALARITRRGGAFEPVHLNRVMDSVLDDLEDAVTRSGAVVIVDALPQVRADRTQMQQLFQNLVANAIKFHGAEPPVIRVFTDAPDANLPRVIVEDNGIGFAPEHAAQIFKPFERLHARGDYEGTGIGLALCRSIMERHGGFIHAETRQDGGARFIVTFPHFVKE